MKFAKTLWTAAAALALGIAAPAQAQSFPARPVTIVAPYPAGGTPDLVARVIGEKMAADWGAPVVVEPKPGGNGVIGTASVAQSAADGYTLLLATLSHVTNPLLQKGVRWDPVADFAGVAEVATAPVVATVPASVPVDSLKAFAEYARKHPRELNYLMPGTGTSMHLNTETFQAAAGIELVAIPYKGTPLGLPDLLTGKLQFAMLPLSTALPQLRTGKLRALAVVSPRRLALIPDVPTLAEAGFPEAQVLSWYAVLAPAKTPHAVVERLNRAVGQAVADPKVQARLEELGVYAADATTPAQVDALLTSESARWKKTFTQLRIEAR